MLAFYSCKVIKITIQDCVRYDNLSDVDFKISNHSCWTRLFRFVRFFVIVSVVHSRATFCDSKPQWLNVFSIAFMLIKLIKILRRMQCGSSYLHLLLLFYSRELFRFRIEVSMYSVIHIHNRVHIKTYSQCFLIIIFMLTSKSYSVTSSKVCCYRCTYSRESCDHICICLS